jgi:hypothetical protein
MIISITMGAKSDASKHTLPSASSGEDVKNALARGRPPKMILKNSIKQLVK